MTIGANQVHSKISSSFATEEEYVYVVDGAVVSINAQTSVVDLKFAEGSLLKAALGEESVETRRVQAVKILAAMYVAAKWTLITAAVGGLASGIYKGVKGDDGGHN